MLCILSVCGADMLLHRLDTEDVNLLPSFGKSAKLFLLLIKLVNYKILKEESAVIYCFNNFLILQNVCPIEIKMYI